MKLSGFFWFYGAITFDLIKNGGNVDIVLSKYHFTMSKYQVPGNIFEVIYVLLIGTI